MASARVSRGRKYGMGRRYALKVMVLGVVGLMSLAGTNPVMAASTQDNGSFWTQFTPSSDTRLIFVSSSEGNDANNGLTPATPVKTLARGHELLRNGFPDWMLLKRGDTWNESFPAWSKNGRSESEMLVVGAYGDAPDRPKIRPASGVSGMNVVGTRLTNHIAFVGFHLEPLERINGESSTGIRWLRRSHNILFEDLYVGGFKDNFTFTGGETTPVENIRINGCVIADSWSATSHSQGIYASRVDGLTIENSVLTSNGFNQEQGVSGTIFNHNIYIQHGVKNVTVRNNIIADASSHGIQLRPGGVIEDNLFLKNSIHILISMDEGSVLGSSSNSVRRNLIIYGKDISPSLPRRMGIDVGGIKGLVLSDNILFNPAGQANGHALFVSDHIEHGMRDVLIADNDIVNWNGRIRVASPREGIEYADVRLHSNRIYWDFPATSSEMVNLFAANHPQVSLSSNVYRFSGSSDRPFRVGSTWTTFAQWASAVEPDATFVQANSSSIDLSLEAYLQQQGIAGGYDEFMQRARNLSRRHSPDYLRPQNVFAWAKGRLPPE